MTSRKPAAGRFARFLAAAVGVVAALGAVGYVPSRRWGGEPAVEAMFAGCVVSLVAAAFGALPLALASPAPQARTQALLLAMALRFFAALGIGLAVVVAGSFARTPFLGWLAISYVALLALEVGFAVRG